MHWGLTMSRFSDTLLDHARSPRHAGELSEYTVTGHADLNGSAPRITMYLLIADNHIVDAAFKAFGCGVTIASCSALTSEAIGKDVDQCLDLNRSTILKALDGIPDDKQFCADLAIDALRDAIVQAGQMDSGHVQ